MLTSSRPEPKYKHLTAADRRAAIEILRATKSDLPSVFEQTLAVR